MTPMSKSKPCLIIVTGRPAAGKSTLAKWLSKELAIPYVSKDNVREILFDGLGWKDREWAQRLGRSAIDVMFYFAEMQLGASCSLILDNTFDPSLSTSRFLDLKIKYSAETLQIVCDSDQETLFNRFRERAKTGKRHPGHHDDLVFDELRTNLAKGQSAIMKIGGSVLQVDTTNFAKIDYLTILQQVKAALRAENGA